MICAYIDGVEHELFVLPVGNVTRLCIANGTWQARSDYSQCSPIMLHPYDEVNVRNGA